MNYIKSDFGFWKLLSNPANMPVKVSVYGGAGSLCFYRLVSSYFAARTPRFTGGYLKKPMEFIQETKGLTNEDYTLLYEFVNEYLKAFGPMRNNHWFKTTPFTAVMRIWMDNREHIRPSLMVSLLQKKLASDMSAIDVGKASGMSACKYARDKFLIFLNDGRSRDLFVAKENEQDQEEDPEEELEE